MKENYTHILAIIDRSGSMLGLQHEIINSFNQFVDDQKKVEGEASMSLVQFDNMYEVNYSFIDINNVPHLTSETYKPRGMTSMYDAIGKSVTETGDYLNGMNDVDKPAKIVVLIQTDGQENSSKEYTQNVIKDMITEQENKYSWEFVFLGANIDAKSTATDIGIKVSNAMTYANTSVGTSSGISSLSNNLKQYRGGGKDNMCFMEDDYASQASEGATQ